MRQAIRAAVPAAEEGIGYGMPAYRLDGKPLLYFAAYKQHWSLFGVRKGLLPELAPFEGDKGTLRFPLEEPVPVKLVGRIARAAAKERRAGPA